MPCRINQSTASYLRSLRWGLGVWVTVLTCAATVIVTQAHAATTPPAEEKTTLTPEWQAVAQAVTQWGAQAYPDAPAILLSDINNRVQPNACTSDLVVDTPFGQSSNVRVRCASPAWQLFVHKLPSNDDPAARRCERRRQTRKASAPLGGAQPTPHPGDTHCPRNAPTGARQCPRSQRFADYLFRTDGWCRISKRRPGGQTATPTRPARSGLGQTRRHGEVVHRRE